jgi:hypothetical protein
VNLTDCPEAVRAYLALTSGDDHESALVTFAETAEVTDDGHTYRGTTEIRKWLARTASAFTYTSTPLTAHTKDGETTVTCRVEGNFPGSPITLEHHFRLDATNRITCLNIAVPQPTSG